MNLIFLKINLFKEVAQPDVERHDLAEKCPFSDNCKKVSYTSSMII